MEAKFDKVLVGLSKYIDETGKRPVVHGSNIPVATIAYRALSGSWSLCELVYQFGLEEVQVLAALLYYQQFCERIDSQEGEFELEFEAMD